MKQTNYSMQAYACKFLKFIWCPLILILLITGSVHAQTQRITVTGTVTDQETGETIIGASVKVKGTSTGASTDNKGKFSINAPSDGVLSIAYVGYGSIEVPINAKTIINIKIKPDNQGLDEVVVVGYGTTRKKDLTGSVASIKKEAIKDVPITRVDQMIQGKAAGVQVTAVDGSPGTGSTIRIRGGNSINASNEPLYVIDGLIGGGDLNLINPQDIESMEILKDASSTAIYGARGANGVILITTKRGASGTDNINFNVYSGWQQVPKFIPMLNATQYAQLANESSLDNGGAVLYPDPQSLGKGTDWQRAISRVAPIQNYTLSASGGKDTYHYFLSGNYINQDGVIINSGFKRYQVRANLDKNVKENVKITAAFNIGRAETKNSTVSLGGQDYGSSALAYSPAATIYNADGSFNSKKPNDNQVYDNPVAQGTLPLNQTTTTNIIGNLGAEWTLIKGLTLKSTFGAELNFVKNNIYNPSTLPTRTNANSGGSAQVNTRDILTWQNENTLSYDKQIGQDHHISAVGGVTFQTSSNEYLNAQGDRYATDLYQYNNLGATAQSTFGIGSDYSKYSIFSLLARINYAYKDKYLVTLTARQDQSSRFAENNKSALFPAVALAWKASNESFIKDLNVFDNLKLRGSFGYNGNQGIDPYKSLASLSNQSGYLIGGQKILGYVGDRIANPNLKWETTRQLDLGLEAGILKGRVNIEIDYYDKRTKDLLLDQQLPLQTGFVSRLTNIGMVGNKGIEILINTVNITTKDFQWETNFNVSRNKSKVLDLGGVDRFSVKNIYFGGNSSISQLQVGQPVGTFWGATYYGTQKTAQVPAGAVNPNSTPRLGDPLYVDKNGDGKFGDEDFGVIGDSSPKFYGGIGNNFTYKQFSLNIYLQGSYGNKVMNVGDAFYNTGDPLTNQFATIADRWTPSNPTSDVPRVNSRNYIPSSRWVYNGSFLRLKSINLGYTFTGAQLHAHWINKLNIYATATNLFLITKYPYYDPETSADGTNSVLRGFDNTNYPQNRTFAFGINLTL